MKTRWLELFVLFLCMILFAGCRQTVFESGVKGEKHPWTNEAFLNSPENFHFAIVADRTGGIRPGVFKKAAEKIDLLRPEFVMSVGDLVTGYTKDQSVLKSQWSEFRGIVDDIDMPFFFVPGNHDITNAVMAKAWQDMFGPAYYYFIYKNVLFICLNTQETPDYIYNSPGRHLSEKQIKWAVDVLRKYKDVSWTFVFMHQPLWVYEEDRQISNGSLLKGKRTGFKIIQEALRGRNCTVFAGHFHQYTKYVRNGQEYFTLGTTGGGTNHNINDGMLDHIVWVAMTSDGPVISQLLLDGIRDENLLTETMMKKNIVKRRFIDNIQAEYDGSRGDIQFRFRNLFKNDLKYDIKLEGEGWNFSPASISGTLASGKCAEKLVKAVKKSDKAEPHPECFASFTTDKDYKFRHDFGRQLFPPVFKSHQTDIPPVIDGKLDDKVWKRLTPYTNFRAKPDGRDVAAKTEAYLCYDKDNFYIAVQCFEPVPGDIIAKVKKHDGSVWKDDSIELFLDTNNDMKTYFQLVVNPAGVTCDVRNKKRSFEFNCPVAASQDGKSWVFEAAIPWKKLDMTTPIAGSRIRGAIVRNRVKSKESQQLPPLFGSNHQPKMFGAIFLDNK